MTALNHINAYKTDLHVAEVYDQIETGQDDVEFIRNLIRDSGSLKILEPFCGTGRILIPLALDGHSVNGMDQSGGMLARLRQKMQPASLEAQKRVGLSRADVLCEAWPSDFDLVILGCNCFYELATSGEQETCVMRAFQSLKPGGHLFLDNNHMEGELAGSWQNIGVVEPSLYGKCSDGKFVECTRETIWFDASQRLARFHRRTKVILPTGDALEREYTQQKHPASKAEMQGWLEKYGFIIEAIYGNYDGVPYMDTDSRAIFWASKR